eukprot:6207529-Pleurochrysis_carterae.AAC.1
MTRNQITLDTQHKVDSVNRAIKQLQWLKRGRAHLDDVDSDGKAAAYADSKLRAANRHECDLRSPTCNSKAPLPGCAHCRRAEKGQETNGTLHPTRHLIRGRARDTCVGTPKDAPELRRNITAEKMMRVRVADAPKRRRALLLSEKRAPLNGERSCNCSLLRGHQAELKQLKG